MYFTESFMLKKTFKINPIIKNSEVFESLLTIPQPGQARDTAHPLQLPSDPAQG